MKIRIVIRPDKSVAVIHPAPKSKRPDETESQWLERVFNKAMLGELKGFPYHDTDSSELPSRENRGAWEFDDVEKKIKINQEKAQQIIDAREKEKNIQKKIREMAEKELNKEG